MKKRGGSTARQKLRIGLASPFAFTLLEVMVVIFIVSIALAVVLPSLPVYGSKLKSDARMSASVLRFINESAVSRKEIISLTFDLETKTLFWQEGEKKREEKIRSLEAVELQSRGKIKDGQLTVFFGPMGLGEYLAMHLKKGEDGMVVSFNPISGRAKVLTVK